MDRKRDLMSASKRSAGAGGGASYHGQSLEEKKKLAQEIFAFVLGDRRSPLKLIEPLDSSDEEDNDDAYGGNFRAKMLIDIHSMHSYCKPSKVFPVAVTISNEKSPASPPSLDILETDLLMSDESEEEDETTKNDPAVPNVENSDVSVVCDNANEPPSTGVLSMPSLSAILPTIVEQAAPRRLTTIIEPVESDDDDDDKIQTLLDKGLTRPRRPVFNLQTHYSVGFDLKAARVLAAVTPASNRGSKIERLSGLKVPSQESFVPILSAEDLKAVIDAHREENEQKYVAEDSRRKPRTRMVPTHSLCKLLSIKHSVDDSVKVYKENMKSEIDEQDQLDIYKKLQNRVKQLQEELDMTLPVKLKRKPVPRRRNGKKQTSTSSNASSDIMSSQGAVDISRYNGSVSSVEGSCASISTDSPSVHAPEPTDDHLRRSHINFTTCVSAAPNGRTNDPFDNLPRYAPGASPLTPPSSDQSNVSVLSAASSSLVSVQFGSLEEYRDYLKWKELQKVAQKQKTASVSNRHETNIISAETLTRRFMVANKRAIREVTPDPSKLNKRHFPGYSQHLKWKQLVSSSSSECSDLRSPVTPDTLRRSNERVMNWDLYEKDMPTPPMQEVLEAETPPGSPGVSSAQTADCGREASELSFAAPVDLNDLLNAADDEATNLNALKWSEFQQFLESCAKPSS